MLCVISVATRIELLARTIAWASFANNQVTFRWRDSAHHNKQRLMTLHVNEFLRRFLLHVLPPGFVRIPALRIPQHTQALHIPAVVFSSACRNSYRAENSSDEHRASVTSKCCVVVPSLQWTDTDSGTMDRGPTSFPLSSQPQLNGGLSQHDLSLHISRMLGVLRCACPACAFRDIGSRLFSYSLL